LKILLIGYSNIARQKIIKTFLKKKIKFCVASKTYKKKISGVYNQFKDYDEGLKKSDADIAYISLPNSLHYYWTLKSLKAGYHVIVDKPICATKNELENLISFAKKNKKLLAEATFFNYHKQIDLTKNKIGDLKNIKHIHVNFIIPYPNTNSILISKKLNGGALMDMGPYAAAVSRIFGQSKIISKRIIFKKNKFKLITGFNLLCEYPTCSYTAYFNFGGEYHNELFLHTDKKTLKIERVFSPPHNQKLSVFIKENNSMKIYKVKKDNAFENFFLEVKNKILNKKYSYYFDRMKSDAYFRNAVLKS